MKTILSEAERVPFGRQIEEVVLSTPALDIHTHLYEPAFQGLLLWGIDELLIYHYLVAEAFRHLELPYERFWALPKAAQADWIWQALFLEHSPVSEACRGVLTTLHLLGLDVKKRDLPALRHWFAAQRPDAYLNRCLELAGLRKVFMTNSPFDDAERPVWNAGFQRDDRFVACLRIDPLLVNWPQAASKLAEWGYQVQAEAPGQKTFDEVRRFLADWTQRMDARYLMVSLPPEFIYPGGDLATPMLEEAVLPFCREHGRPLALMLGVKRGVNPQLQLAGDGVGLSDLAAVQHLSAGHPENKFLLTVLARENQHEACVLARKFRNLHLFGCWWFTNVPELIDEITRLRLELLGLSFTAQHSDARVLDQVVYKWHHSRRILAQVLVEKYTALAQTGWPVTRAELERDVKDLLGGAFERFCARA